MSLLLLFQGGAAGPANITGTMAATLGGVTVAAGGTSGRGATTTVALAGVAVAASGVAGRAGAVSAQLDSVTTAFSGTVSTPTEEIFGDLAATLAGVSAGASGVRGSGGAVGFALAGVSVESAATAGHSADVAALLDGITAGFSGTALTVEVGGSRMGQYGSIDFWLRQREDDEEEAKPAAPQKAVQIIKRVAEKQAEKREFTLAPLKVAFQRANYKFQPNYADIYRRAYEAALARLRHEAELDDEEAIVLLM